MPEKIKKTSNDVSVRDLNKDDGLNVFLAKAKSLYEKDINALAFLPNDRLENFRQFEDLSIVDFFNESERSNNQIMQFDMNLPTGVLAYEVQKMKNNS